MGLLRGVQPPRRRARVDAFIDAIWLEGFDERSVWGYDSGIGSFSAQVWQTWHAAERLTKTSISGNLSMVPSA